MKTDLAFKLPASGRTRPTCGAHAQPRPSRPLAALAARLGVAGLCSAQTPPAAAADPAADGQTPVIIIIGSAERAGRDGVQATTTRIGKGLQELRDVPQSLTVVTEKLIDDRNLDTLKDALHNTAGVSFLAAEGGEEDIRLRGFSLQATGDIFVDALRASGSARQRAHAHGGDSNRGRLWVIRGLPRRSRGRSMHRIQACRIGNWRPCP